MTTPTIQWSALAPDLILFGGAGFLLLASIVVADRRARDVAMVVGMGCFIGSLIAVGVIWDYGGGSWTVLQGQFVVDQFANVVRVIVAGSGLLALMGAYGWSRLRQHGPEFVAFLLVAAVLALSFYPNAVTKRVDDTTAKLTTPAATEAAK